jgi:hypothetical protein
MDGQRFDPVRDLVIETFRDFGAEESELAGMTDTLLIREGRYYGRSFRTDKLMAMWMAGFVQFYDHDGEMLKTVLVGSEPESRAKAA